MSYRRRVSCSYCGLSGHNKASCAVRKERIEKKRLECGDDHYLVAAYDGKKRLETQRRSRPRTCSYCKERGHNRRSCQHLKTAISAMHVRNREYRQNFLNAIIEHGLGPGTMIKSRREAIYLITGILWEDIHIFGRRNYAFRSIRAQNVQDREDWGLVSDCGGLVKRESYRGYEILVKTSEEQIRKSLPNSFLTEESSRIPDQFNDKDKVKFYSRDWYGSKRVLDPSTIPVVLNERIPYMVWEDD